MTIIDHEIVRYEQNLQPYKVQLELSNSEKNIWYEKAATMHHLNVRGELFKLMSHALVVGNATKNPSAKLHLKFGAGRRSKAIWHSMGTLLETVAPDRKKPMLRDDVEKAAQDLNSIYINIRGLLDNLAWSIVHLLEINIRPQNVGLFNKSILNNVRVQSLAQNLSSLKEWSTELSTRRDPAAHQIPLTIPPAFLNPEQAKTVEKIWNEREQEQALALEKIRSGEDPMPHFGRIEQLFTDLESVGSFRPFFCHDENHGLYPIYPTVPEDIGKMLIAADYALELITEIS